MDYRKGGKYSAPFSTLYNTYGTGGYVLKIGHGNDGYNKFKKDFHAIKVTKTINNSTRFIAIEWVFLDSFSRLIGLTKYVLNENI